MSYDPYIFQVGETVILGLDIKDSTNTTYVDPDSIIVQIKNPSGSIVVGGTVGGTPMSKDATGQYHYDFGSSSQTVGKWTVVYTATTGTRVVKIKDHFHLEVA